MFIGRRDKRINASKGPAVASTVRFLPIRIIVSSDSIACLIHVQSSSQCHFARWGEVRFTGATMRRGMAAARLHLYPCQVLLTGFNHCAVLATDMKATQNHSKDADDC